MADDRHKGKGRRGPDIFEETLQVRVRKRNPLIERRSSRELSDTRALAPSSVDEVSMPIVVTPRMELGDEKSDTTQEIAIEELSSDLAESRRSIEADPLTGGRRRKDTRVRSSGKKRPGERKKSPVSTSDVYMDEDATEIADSPPGTPPPRPARGRPRKEPPVLERAPKEKSAASGRKERAQAERAAGGRRAEVDPGEPGLRDIHPVLGITGGRPQPGEGHDGPNAARPGWQASGRDPQNLRREPPLAREPPRVESGETRPRPEGPQVKINASLTDKIIRRKEPPLRPEPDSPIPRELLGKWGTDAVGPSAQRAQINRLEQALPQVSAPALKILRAELNAEELQLLERTLAGEVDARGVEPGLSPKRSLEHLINEPHFSELSVPERAKLLRAISAEPRDIATIKSAIALVKTNVARRLRPADRERLFQLFLALESETRALLARLAARGLRGRSALEDHDLKDTSLLSHLLAIAAERPLAADAEHAGIERPRIMATLLGAIAHPERLPFEESGDGVLGMLEFGLADSSPAELARLWLQLLTGDMSAELASGEGRLDLGQRLREGSDSALGGRDSPIRLGLEDLAALARPKKSSGDRLGFVMPGNHGVDADVISRALGLLYGVGFTVAAGTGTARRHLSRVSRDTQRVPPVYVTLLYDRGERLFVFDHADEDSVFLRAPHGRSTKRKGTQRTDPLRWVEDVDLGLDRISGPEFDAWVGVALIPRT